jgi:hypothetical protein
MTSSLPSGATRPASGVRAHVGLGLQLDAVLLCERLCEGEGRERADRRDLTHEPTGAPLLAPAQRRPRSPREPFSTSNALAAARNNALLASLPYRPARAKLE